MRCPRPALQKLRPPTHITRKPPPHQARPRGRRRFAKDDVSLERHRRVFSSGMWCCRRRTTRRGSVAPGIRPTMPRAGVPCGVPDVFLSRCKVYVTLKTPSSGYGAGFCCPDQLVVARRYHVRIAAKNDAVTHLCHFASTFPVSNNCCTLCQQSAS